MKILAIDYGEKRIGLALGDTESKIALPLKTIKNLGYEFVVQNIRNIIAEWEINKIILGIPEIFHDQEINKKIQNFGDILKKSLNIEIIFYNEDFSSNYASADLNRQMQVGRKKKINKEEIDRIAATIILQSYFENEILKRADTGNTSKN